MLDHTPFTYFHPFSTTTGTLVEMPTNPVFEIYSTKNPDRQPQDKQFYS